MIDPKLYDYLAPYLVRKDSDMPYVYQATNPFGRPLHDDWGIMRKDIPGPAWFKDIVGALQPWQKRPRILDAYMVPLPFRRIAGNAEPIWTPILRDGWPLAGDDSEIARFDYWDGAKTVPNVLHVKTMHPIHKAGEWSRQAAFIGGAWRECFFSQSWNIKGKRLTYYNGLKLDPHPIDLMCWGHEMSLSLK